MSRRSALWPGAAILLATLLAAGGSAFGEAEEGGVDPDAAPV